MRSALPRPTPADLRARLVGRLALVEPLSAAHEPGLLAAAEDAEMFAWMPVDMSSPQALREWLRDALTAAQADREVPFAVRDARSGEVVGSTRFMELRFEHLRAEIGWTWVRRSSWSTGINVETKLLLLGRAFECAGLRRVEFKTDARNERSRGALRALGATFEGVLRSHMVLGDGSPRDSAYFSVIDSEWPALRERLSARVARHAAR
ncbi:MAG TPA: GNAT family protein [Solirubrobacteraceae bacterium]